MSFGPPSRPHRIVLVDDDPEVLAALGRATREEAYEVLSTLDPLTALGWLRDWDVGVLLARNRTADQVAARVRDGPDLPHGRVEIRRLGLGHGLDGDRCATADRDAADRYLALGGHAPRVAAGGSAKRDRRGARGGV